MLPQWHRRRDRANLASIYAVPHCCLSFAGFLALEKWGGPKFRSAEIVNRASLIRCALVTFPEWRPLLDRLQALAEECLPAVQVVEGQLSPAFWQAPPLVSLLCEAASGFECSQKWRRAGRLAVAEATRAIAKGDRK
eukprot:6415784-Pyramimonas_sp.AAC.1